MTGVVAIVDREAETEDREDATEADLEVVAVAVEGWRSAASGLDGELDCVASDLHGVATVQERKLDEEKVGINLPPPSLSPSFISISVSDSFFSLTLSISFSSCKRTAG